ncbi:MAG: ABC transporter permease [Solirubrobacterales bacterium]
MSTAAAEPLAAGGPVAAAKSPRDWRKPAALIFAALIYFFLYAPIIVMAIFSFNEGSVQSLPLKGFSTIWYDRLAHDQEMIDAVVFSFKVSLIAVAISSVAGTAFALLFTRVRLRGLPVLQALIALPFVMPGMVLGISLLLSLREVGVQPGMLAIVIGHIIFITPVIIFVVSQRLRSLDPTLEQASHDLGAGSLRTFVNVTFPSIRTSLLAAALLGFTVSFDEIIVTFFLAGAEPTLPVRIWTLLRQGFSPTVNAVLTLIALGSITLITVAAVIIHRTGTKDA